MVQPHHIPQNIHSSQEGKLDGNKNYKAALKLHVVFLPGIQWELFISHLKIVVKNYVSFSFFYVSHNTDMSLIFFIST